MKLIADIPDAQTVELLALFPTGVPGVQARESEYIWRDADGIPRGNLSVWPDDDVYSFVVRVHPDWRRRGIATALYKAASRDWMLHETEFTALGRLWIKAVSRSQTAARK
jgi:GNAT superfamily N-acetyltransferase